MSAQMQIRALRVAARHGGTFAPHGQSGFAIQADGDRRRRPLARLSAQEAKSLEREGALVWTQAGFALTDAGRARVTRGEAPVPDAPFRAQHGALEDRFVADERGRVRSVRAAPADAALRRLAALRDGSGGSFLTKGELAAARRLSEDRDLGALGLIAGQDWAAPPRGSAPRGQGNGLEAAHTGAIDARARVAAALKALAEPLARVARASILEERGLEAVEAEAGWPARSGKIGLKLALAQLARHYGFG